MRFDKEGNPIRNHLTPEETKKLASERYEKYTPTEIEKLVIQGVLTVVKEFTQHPAQQKPSRKHLSPFIE